MKNLLSFIAILLGVLLLTGCTYSTNSYLRVHIRANSNSEKDQEIKYFVKDVIVEYLTPKLIDCKSKNEVICVLNDNLEKIKSVATQVLEENGFNYGCSVEINEEFFPTRTYDDLTLKADYYDALIVKLGSGSGDNWWCVMYPNLCFKEIDNVVYKSKIKEIIDKIKE